MPITYDVKTDYLYNKGRLYKQAKKIPRIFAL